MRYGSKEHEEFAKLAEEVRNHLATSFAMYFNHDPCDAWHLMESTELTHGLYDQIVEFQELCNAAAVPGVELCENEYQTKSRALAGRFQSLADKLDLNSAGRRVLQDSIVGQAPRCPGENMDVNSGVEGENTCECGRVWLLAKRKVPQRDKDDLSCNCGKTLVRWNGGCVWTAKLIKDVPSGA
jgi:hypothetical protein